MQRFGMREQSNTSTFGFRVATEHNNSDGAASLSLGDAQSILESLAGVFYPAPFSDDTRRFGLDGTSPDLPGVDAIYRTLVEQIPAVVFMAVLDKGIGEAYV